MAHQAPLARKLKKTGFQTAHSAILAIFIIFTAMPFAWMLITAFKTDSELSFNYNPSDNPFWFRELPTLEQWHYIFTETYYLKWLLNTGIVGAAVVGITLLLAIPAAYALARLLGRWGGQLGIGIFLVYLVPPTLLFIPMAQVVSWLKIQNTLWSLILVYPTITVPFSTWLLMGFFKSIPRDLEEQAMVDGYSRLDAFRKIMMPLAIPGIITIAIFTFTLSIQEFVYAATFVTSAAVKTVSVGVPAEMVHGDIFKWGWLMGSAFVASVPTAILYYVVLDRFISGFTAAGAIR